MTAKRWRAIVFIICLSWFFPPFSEPWRQIDTFAFYQFNHLLGLGPWVQWTVAYMTQSWFDWVVCAVLGICCCIPGLVFCREQYRTGLYGLLFATIITYVIKLLWPYCVPIARASPSLLFDVDYLLPQLVPNLRHVKFMSPNSFPADHAAIILTCAVCLMAYGKRYARYAAIVIAILLCLPRLISGAHWLTDVMIGGILVALMSFSCVHMIEKKKRLLVSH